MADIAAVFHWPLDRLEAMDAVELFAWRVRWNRRQGRGE